MKCFINGQIMWYRGVGGGLYTGPSGGMYKGLDSNPYMSNIPPWDIYIKELKKRGYNREAEIILKHLR